jgi:hypothetical protein
MPDPRLTSDDVVRRGKALYEQHLRAKLEAGNKGKFLVINVETGEYEIGDDYGALSDQLHAADPDAPLFAMRIGYPAVGRIGGRISLKSI